MLIASDIAAAREVVRHRDTGILFPVGDVDALARLVVEATADEGLQVRIGRHARRRSRAYEIETAVGKYVRTFDEVIRLHVAGSLPAGRYA